MNFLQTVKTVLSLLPLIIQAIQSLEAAVPATGQGAAKLEAIKATLQAAYQGANDAMGSFEQLWPVIQASISSLVGLFNSTGVFKKTA